MVASKSLQAVTPGRRHCERQVVLPMIRPENSAGPGTVTFFGPMVSRSVSRLGSSGERLALGLLAADSVRSRPPSVSEPSPSPLPSPPALGSALAAPCPAAAAMARASLPANSSLSSPRETFRSLVHNCWPVRSQIITW